MTNKLNKRAGRLVVQWILGVWVLFGAGIPVVAQNSSDARKTPPILKSERFIVYGEKNADDLKKIATGSNDFITTFYGSPRLSTSGESVAFVFGLNGLSESETALLNDAADGKWDRFSLFEAALIAEGLASPEERRPYLQKYERLQRLLESNLKQRDDLKERTQLAYEFLHQNVLTNRYDLNRSSLVDCFDNGVFNCVSATILFNCFAESIGLDVYGLEATGHAKSRVKFDDEYLDIETTCPQWSLLPDKFEPLPRSVAVLRPRFDDKLERSPESDGSTASEFIPTSASARSTGSEDLTRSVANRAVQPAFLEKEQNGATEILPNEIVPSNVFESTAAPLGYSYISGKRNMREISSVELIATIYYNQGVDFYQNKKYVAAIAAYIKALCLDPENETIRGNLNATLNNWAIQLATTQNDFSKAILVAEYGTRLDPNFKQFQTNLPIFYQHWIDELQKKGDSSELQRVKIEYQNRFSRNQ